MNNLKASFFILLLFLLVGCESKEEVSTALELEDDLREVSFISNDGKVNFKLHNDGDFPSDEIAYIQAKIIASYDIITSSISVDYEPARTIDIYLYWGTNRSRASIDSITLYKNEYRDFPLVHELTHSLLGYGKSYSESTAYGLLTQEGFAEYLQYKYGNVVDSHYWISKDQYVKFLLEKEKIIPL